MTDTNTQIATAAKKVRQGRSPAYPSIPLGKALERAETLRVAEGGRPKHFIPWNSICKAWDLGPKTGPAKQAIAALGYFGLFEFEGSGEERSARLTEAALRILLDKQPVSPERDELIQKVALTPTIHRELRNRWPADLPSESTLETYLVRDRGFSETGARELISEYKATLSFAKLNQPAKLPDVKEDNYGDNPPPASVRVGDLVQAEVGGVLAFDKPKRVRAIQEGWVFVDGHEAGIQMDQVQVTEKGDKPPIDPPRLPLDSASPDWREERLLDEAGDEIFIKYKGEPSKARYEFIRDYLNFKVTRMK